MLNVPQGVYIRRLAYQKQDHRGSFFEAFRQSWLPYDAQQWNVVNSVPRVMRGMHVHPYDEYYLFLSGAVTLTMRDTRAGAPTESLSTVLEIDADTPHLAAVPRGVIHGLYFASAACALVGLSREWDGAADLGCHWTDPDLGIDWTPPAGVIVSDQDDALPALREIRALIPPYQTGD